MRNRSKVVICWELLKVLSFGPQGPSRLAAKTNVPFDRLGEYLEPMVASRLVRKDSAEGRDLYRITPEGMDALGELDKVLPKLVP